MFKYLFGFNANHSITKDDVEWCYSLLLGRTPESKEITNGYTASKINLKTLVEAVVSSPEYQCRIIQRASLDSQDRANMTISCRDCDVLPKVPNSGQIVEMNGERMQIMHEGTLVKAGAYGGDWTMQVIKELQGHHEPQEELIFHHLLTHTRPGSRIVELGAFWAYYSNWYLGAVPSSSAICVEPDENNINIGKYNMLSNNRNARWINACIGTEYSPEILMKRESDETEVPLPCHNMDSLLDEIGIDPIEMLHIDAQGAELGFILSLEAAASRGLLRFLVVSTHHASISGSPSTHRDSLHALIGLGASILCEHSVEESFSGDGLIVASFIKGDAGIALPEISRNTPERSLYGHASRRSKKSYNQEIGSKLRNQPDDLPVGAKIVQSQYGPMRIAERDSVIGLSLASSGMFQEHKITEVVSFLKKEKGFKPVRFIDIGANIGTHLIYALKTENFQEAVGCEADPYKFSLLKQNIEGNNLWDRTKIFSLAISDRSGAAQLELCDSNFGDHRIRNALAVTGEFGEEKRQIRSVLMDRFDTLMDEFGIAITENTLIWVDTQGHEGHVFSGITLNHALGRRPFIVTEFWPYGLERAGGRTRFLSFINQCSSVYEINQERWSENPRILSGADIALLYENMLAEMKENQYPHTDLLCIA